MSAVPSPKWPEGTIRHSSTQVYCWHRGEAATISVVERVDEHGARRFVLWCSLRPEGQCDEHCLRGEPPAP